MRMFCLLQLFAYSYIPRTINSASSMLQFAILRRHKSSSENWCVESVMANLFHLVATVEFSSWISLFENKNGIIERGWERE